jgi:hypothetical protein
VKPTLLHCHQQGTNWERHLLFRFFLFFFLLFFALSISNAWSNILGYKLVLFTNQAGAAKSAEKKKSLVTKIMAVSKDLGCPIHSMNETHCPEFYFLPFPFGLCFFPFYSLASIYGDGEGPESQAVGYDVALASCTQQQD